MIKPYIIFNGKILPADQALFSAGHRSIRYGDGLFETIRSFSGRLVFFKYHFQRLEKGANFLEMDLPPELSYDNLLILISELIKANKISGDSRIRLSLFRNGDGYYYSSSRLADFLLEIESSDSSLFNNAKSKYKLTFCRSVKRSSGPLSNLKTLSALNQIIAAKEVRAKNFDEGIILNEFGRIACGVSSNIFLVSKDKIFTPKLPEACVAGTMRQALIDLLTLNGYNISESEISPAELLNADEVFLTNAVRGIISVSEVDGISFTNNFSQLFMAMLNQVVNAS
jgi:branched-subunit amino acid aminotransferase/4-amino-4-deoxychorismate lyase